MLFSSITFIYYFIPVVLGLYYIVPKQYKNLVLLLSSLFFYFCGEPVYSLLMLASIASGYLHGIWISKAKDCGRKGYARMALISSIVVSIGLLVFFKYADFLIENMNILLHADIPLLRLTLPIGISFYSFQILSYTIDVYRGDAGVQKNIISFAAYVSLFPQLIAGPIVRYTDVEAELSSRTHSIENAAGGISRFVIGLSKKIILANTLGELVKTAQGSSERTVLMGWLSAIAYAFQIYYDFSGYSDMAIGLGRIFGFTFPENFNYPYISKSITEFWRRWHMTLGTWFRDYVYIPMGGNRVGKARWIFNIIVVWFLTGLWHGAEWTFIIWGLYFALLLVLEKIFLKGLLDRLPSAFARIYVIFLVIMSFVIFNSDSTGGAIESIMGMLGLLKLPLYGAETLYYMRSYGAMLALAAFGATPLAAGLYKRVVKSRIGSSIINILEPTAVMLLLAVITGYLVDGSFNPFLYFRF